MLSAPPLRTYIRQQSVATGVLQPERAVCPLGQAKGKRLADLVEALLGLAYTQLGLPAALHLAEGLQVLPPGSAQDVLCMQHRVGWCSGAAGQSTAGGGAGQWASLQSARLQVSEVRRVRPSRGSSGLAA